MDALASAARAGTHAQATVRRKWQLWQNIKAGDKRGFKGIAPWKENSNDEHRKLTKPRAMEINQCPIDHRNLS